MHRSKWLNSLLALLVIFISFSALTGEYENEADLIKAANKHFSKGEYTQCLELFSQLVSNHPQNSNYNYKYGTCLLFSTEDKQEAIKFLKFSIKNGDVDPDAFFYYGRALHLNYQFSEAKTQYIKFRTAVKFKISEEIGISAYIAQCISAEKLIDEIHQIDVIYKKKVSRKEFFRSYRLSSIKRNIIVKPAEFQTKEDKKAEEYSLIVHNPMNEVIYISGYNKKDGMGGKDIFKIQKMPDGTFSEPINVGPSVNTMYDEDFPYLHPNGRILYFASKGHNSIGGYDIFRSELDTLLNLWGDAVNVGFAVNSPDDDILYVSDMDENMAYFASSRENKLGEITVYKILPNSNKVPVVIVRGEIFIEGSTKNDALIIVYDEDGEEVGVYNSQQQSGAFTMTLAERKTYSLGLSILGREEQKVDLVVPAKSEKAIISKRFVIENGLLKIVDNSELLANADFKKKIIAESAKLNVNQTKDVEFNTKIKKKQPKKTPVIEELPELPDEIAVVDETMDLTASAAEELKEIEDAETKIKKQIDATYFVAKKKRIKSGLIKNEIEELSEELADAYSEVDKAVKRGKITEKQTELKISTTEAVSAIEFAQVKEKELRIKVKEKESAKAYLSAVKAAESSNNGSSAIAAIERARDNLNAIQKDIKRMQADDGSARALAKVDAAKKNVADKELAVDIAEQDVKDIVREQKDLADQSESTKNKGLKEELNLQINELDAELKRKKVKSGVKKGALTEAKSELAVLESSKNIYAEIQQESEEESLVVVTDEQKAEIQKEVAFVQKEEITKAKKPAEKVSKTKTVDAVNAEIEEAYKKGEVTNAQQYNDELRKAEIKRQELASIREEKALMELSLVGPGSKREKKSIQDKINELTIQEDQAIKDVRVYVEKAKTKETTLTAIEKNTNSEKLEELITLEKIIQNIEKVQEEGESATENTTSEVIEETPIATTENIVLDIETATDSEIENIIASETKIKLSECSTENNWEGFEAKSKEIKKLKKEVATLLKESNTAQITAEKNGQENSETAQNLKKKAFEKLFTISELEGEINKKEFDTNRSLLEKEFSSRKEMNTDDLKAKTNKVTDDWTKASGRRALANNTKDEVEKIKLINEAAELEHIALDSQKELTVQINNRSEFIVNEEAAQKATENIEVEVTSEEPDVIIPNEVVIASNPSAVIVDETDPINEVAIVSEDNSEETIEEGVIPEEPDVIIPNEVVIASNPSAVIVDKTDPINEVAIVSDDNPEKTIEEEVISEESDVIIPNEVVIAVNPSAVIVDETAPINEVAIVSDENIKETIKENEIPNKADNPAGVKTENGFGITRAEEFNYGPSSATTTGLKVARKLDDEASDFYSKAESLKQKAKDNPEDAKKYNKEAGKLLKKGAKIQEEANEQFQKVNASELAYNDSEITFALDNEDIVQKELAILIAKGAKDLFESAQTIRKSAGKVKDPEESTELINKAYNMELEALNKQNYILTGELDGEQEEEFEVVDKTIKKEENDYTRKADALRIQADNETDDIQKKALFVEARRYDLAGNSKRTKRIQEELIANKIVFENNKGFVISSREQSNNNTPANKAYDYELESDSLFALAESIRIKAENNSDQVTRIEQIKSSKDLMAEAKEAQAAAIRKYRESRSAKAEPDFIAKFRTQDIEEKLANTDVINTDVNPEVIESNTEINEIEEVAVVAEPENIEEVIEEEEAVIVDNIVEKVAIIDEQKVEEELIVTNNITESSEEVVTTINVEENVVDPVVEDNNQNTVVSSSVAFQVVKDGYKELTVNAKTIEIQEVARVERIEILKGQSKINKDKSEELLSTVDAMEDESEILKTIAKANEYRNKAEQQEVEADNEEIILKNNIAEGAAMRKEADLILGSLQPDIKDEIIKENENNSPDLAKIKAFLDVEKTRSNEPVEELIEVDFVDEPAVVAVANPDVIVNNKVVQEPINNQLSKPNLKASKILGAGSTEEQISKDEFIINSTKKYSSSGDIPMDIGMPKGIIYQVQVGAFRNKIDPSVFNGLSPLVGEQSATGIIRYKVGYFRGFKSANMAKGRIRNLGYRDAFVVVFLDGKRVTLEDAVYVIKNADESEKFVYDNLVEDEIQKLMQLGIPEAEGELDPVDVSSSPVVINNVTNESTVARSNGLDNDLLKVGGVFYTVQVGVFRSPRLSSDLSGVSPLLTEKLNNGFLRYSTGVYRDYVSAETKKVNVRKQGIKDAFVIAYNGTKKVSTTEAKALASATESASNETAATDKDLITFKVQVGAYRVPIIVANTPVFKDLTNYEISSIERPSGLLLYMVGSYVTKAEADDLRRIVVAAGGTDCFVVAIQNGKRITMRTALYLLNK